MSHTFSVAAPTPPDYKKLMKGLPFDDVLPEGDQEEPTRGPWPEGIRHYYRDGLSTRGVEVSWEDGAFAVRINTLAAPEDYDLAMHFIERAAELLKAPIDPEGGDTVAANELRSAYDADWIRRTNEVGMATVGALISGGDHDSIRLGGVIRDVYLGPRVWGELTKAGPKGKMLDRLVEFMRHVQYVNADGDYFAANVMTLQQKKKGKTREVTVTAFGAGVSYLFPSVEYLVVTGETDGEEMLFVPYKKLPDLLRDEWEWEWLDEEQTLVEPVAEGDWPELRARAGKLAVSAP
jgi:hypothetical protein